MYPTSPTTAVGSFKSYGSASDLLAAENGEFPQNHYTGNPRGRVAIDYTKFKTRVCRNYQHGLACPFQDRCVFSHGEKTVSAPLASHRSSLPPPPSFEEFQSSAESSPVKGAGAPPPPPPSYVDTIATVASANDSPRNSDSGTPPSYPSRFRYEPYSASGIIYEY